MLVKCNTGSLTSCCFYAVLDFLFFFLPFKLHKDVIIEGIETRVQFKNEYQPGNFTKWCLECLFLYLGDTGVWNVPRIAPCLFIKSLLNNPRLFLWISQYKHTTLTTCYNLTDPLIALSYIHSTRKPLTGIFLCALMPNYWCNNTNRESEEVHRS